MAKENNPVKIVQVNANDHRPPPDNTSVDQKVFDGGDSVERRRELSDQARSLGRELQSSFGEWPDVAAVAKVTLKEEALAKSHRPTGLFSARSCPIIGTLGFGELLVSVSPTGLGELVRRFEENYAKKVSANISAVECIEIFSSHEKVHGLEVKEDIKGASSNFKNLKIKLFDHKERRKNNELRKAVEKIAEEQRIELQSLSYGTDGDLLVVRSAKSEDVEKLANFVGVRSLSPMPSYSVSDFSVQMSQVGLANDEIFPPPAPGVEYPVVGIIDSGTCPNNSFLSPWVIARETFVPAGEENFNHGTMVAGLIVSPKTLNHDDPRFPDTKAKIVDVNVFPKGGTVLEEDLVSAIGEVVPKYPDVKVWNLSLGSSNAVEEFGFSDFAQFLDELHDKYGCLFVIASGNQSDPVFWPTFPSGQSENRVSSPSDSVRALTVGSIAHKDSHATLVKENEVSPFSRVGPGPCFIPKPEVVHYGGNTSSTGVYSQTGILSLGQNGALLESIGTSFAAPIVSNQAAALYSFLSQDGTAPVNSETVKALLVHSALLGNGNICGESLSGYGFGKPGNIEDILYCDDHCMTMLFEADVKHGGYEFERFPFPIADCLYTPEGKFRAEVLMTLVYSPVLDQSFASEYCRTNVDANLGSYVMGDDGKRSFSARIPSAPKDINEMYEKVRVEHGFKWSPVKAYHKIFPRGVDISEWRLKMKVMRRAEEEMPENNQRAILVLTLRALDKSSHVYDEMVVKMNQVGWITTDIDHHLRLKI